MNDIAVWDAGEGPSEEMKASAKTAAGDIEVKVKPYLHLCQSKSPEVEREGKANVGDYFVRNGDYNLGQNFQGVVVGHCVNWVRWGDKDTPDEGKILWEYPDNCVPDHLQDQCEWRDGQGDKRVPPIANLTHVFMILPVSKTGVDPRGVVALNMDRSGVKIAEKQILTTLDSAIKEGWHPSCIVLNFSSKKEVTPDFVWQAVTCERVGQINNKALQDKLIQTYDTGKAQVLAHKRKVREENLAALPPVGDNAPDSVKAFFDDSKKEPDHPADKVEGPQSGNEYYSQNGGQEYAQSFDYGESSEPPF